MQVVTTELSEIYSPEHESLPRFVIGTIRQHSESWFLHFAKATWGPSKEQSEFAQSEPHIRGCSHHAGRVGLLYESIRSDVILKENRTILIEHTPFDMLLKYSVQWLPLSIWWPLRLLTFLSISLWMISFPFLRIVSTAKGYNPDPKPENFEKARASFYSTAALDIFLTMAVACVVITVERRLYGMHKPSATMFGYIWCDKGQEEETKKKHYATNRFMWAFGALLYVGYIFATSVITLLRVLGKNDFPPYLHNYISTVYGGRSLLYLLLEVLTQFIWNSWIYMVFFSFAIVLAQIHQVQGLATEVTNSLKDMSMTDSEAARLLERFRFTAACVERVSDMTQLPFAVAMFTFSGCLLCSSIIIYVTDDALSIIFPAMVFATSAAGLSGFMYLMARPHEIDDSVRKALKLFQSEHLLRQKLVGSQSTHQRHSEPVVGKVNQIGTSATAEHVIQFLLDQEPITWKIYGATITHAANFRLTYAALSAVVGLLVTKSMG
eukprot:TRINITY_DN10735_c0_g1_i1.p1 TRINITY_DN10735_c0_g1~~TRINITY_DN10735_c0_g1_i1.p1  ORF type:complete len:494 (-),score=83.25 TRINITY_DN10735_c0_g1_i1:59-1540(-)